ncbi:hypothetical protein [Tepidimonas charontis]|uniref:PXPV repeat (3 copies) n=1 Tax=Tepidimonas charontis TaxID=2267262 RepID=A0A554XFF9_9BURK|nr:hypothetical protein [Tepidimonas charontis]TSE34555.1 hypothetical protein Tchar_01325 [Tepidimonas charontis]
MNAMRLFHARRPWRLLAAVALTMAGTAQAADVYWSVGVYQPGVSVRVGNTPPLVWATAPTVVVAPPVVVATPVMVAPPARVVTAPPALVVAPGVVYGVPPGHLKHKHGHRSHGRGYDAVVWAGSPYHAESWHGRR